MADQLIPIIVIVVAGYVALLAVMSSVLYISIDERGSMQEVKAFDFAGKALLVALLAILLIGLSACVMDEQSKYRKADVVRIVDGDTLVVVEEWTWGYGQVEELEYAVRLIGVDCPESVSPDEEKNCDEGVVASEYTKSLLSPGDTVYLQIDTSESDQYGRKLRYVWLEEPHSYQSDTEAADKMLNALIVHNGYAQAVEYAPDTAYCSLFSMLGEEAIENEVGVTYLWG